MTYEENKEATEKWINARNAYRNRNIGDDEYLQARAEWEDNQRKFDEDRGEAAWQHETA